MAQQQAIKLKIAGKSYSFTLKHEANEEQSLAEKEEDSTAWPNAR